MTPAAIFIVLISRQILAVSSLPPDAAPTPLHRDKSPQTILDRFHQLSPSRDAACNIRDIDGFLKWSGVSSGINVGIGFASWYERHAFENSQTLGVHPGTCEVKVVR